MPKVSVIIPCHNEEQSIGGVVDGARQCADEIIVVDNNSTDATSSVAQTHGARVVIESMPGYGAALLCGFRAARGDIIVTLDGDGQYPTEKISELTRLLLDNNLDFITASRFPLEHARAMPRVRQLGNAFLTFATNMLFGLHVRDSQSGMWVFRRSALPLIQLESRGMALSEEIKIRFFLHPRVKCAEYHIPYYERTGSSKLSIVSDGLGNVRYLFALRRALFHNTRQLGLGNK